MIKVIEIENTEQLQEIGKKLKEAAFKDANFFPPQYSKTKEEAYERAKDATISEEIRRLLFYKGNYYSVVMTYDSFLRIPTYHLSMSCIKEDKNTLFPLVTKVDDETAKFLATNLLGNYTEHPDETPFQTIRHFLETIV